MVVICGARVATDILHEHRRHISKFASVQARLREWNPSARKKIRHLSCIQIQMLDIDGFRMDKGEEITVDAQGNSQITSANVLSLLGRRTSSYQARLFLIMLLGLSTSGEE